jgi:uncharacterized membrane protein YdjX (TVP38/TMEM64 family)
MTPIRHLKSAFQNLAPWLGGLLVITLLAALWPLLSRVDINSAALRAWLEQSGPLAPLVFFALNVAQIVVAPIPGYPVQVLGGILFGFIPGAIYTVGGMVTGGVLAAWLSRRLGRPWLEKRVGADTLARWTQAARVNSFWTWWFILILPFFGDIPYFAAGLSRIRLRVLALAILTSRGPFTALFVWAGHRAIDLPLPWLIVFMAALVLVVLLAFSQMRRIEAWGRVYLTRWGDQKGAKE